MNAVADEVEKWRKENCPERQIYLTMFAYYSTFDAPVKEVNGELVPISRGMYDDVHTADGGVLYVSVYRRSE